ncbi:MAG: putative ABC transporter permease [Candidatus Izemoplasmataceae bacterium]
MHLFMYVLVYAFFGWLLEVSYYFFKTRTFVNRGFLIGPYVPIYGISALLIHSMLNPYINDYSQLNLENILLIFGSIILVSTMLELIGGMVLHALFGIRWWDYSEEKFNFKGYICLKFSIYWGLLGTLFYSVIHLGFIVPFINSLNESILRTIVLFVVPLLLVDYFITILSLVNFKALLNELRLRLAMVEDFAQEIKEHLPKGLLQRIDQLKDNEHFKSFHQRFEDLKTKLIDIKPKKFSNDVSLLSDINKSLSKNRLFKAFPDLKIPFKKRTKKRDSNE